MRYDGPVETSTTRWASEDVMMHRQKIRRGDVIRVVLSSANWDPDCCHNPSCLDISRQEQHHLAFGHGIHYCLGAPLARLEGRIALDTILKRLPDLHLSIAPDSLTWRSGVRFRGLERLPVQWRTETNNLPTAGNSQ